MYKIGLAILIGLLITINLLPTQTDIDAQTINNDGQVYEEIYTAITNLEDSVNLSKYGPLSVEDALNIARKVLDDHPEIFYFNYKDSVYYSNGKFEIKYIDSKTTVKNMVKELDNKIDNILKKYIISLEVLFLKDFAIIITYCYYWLIFIKNTYVI